MHIRQCILESLEMTFYYRFYPPTISDMSALRAVSHVFAASQITSNSLNLAMSKLLQSSKLLPSV